MNVSTDAGKSLRNHQTCVHIQKSANSSHTFHLTILLTIIIRLKPNKIAKYTKKNSSGKIMKELMYTK